MKNKLRLGFVGCLSLLLLAGCGGSGGASSVAPSVTPTSSAAPQPSSQGVVEVGAVKIWCADAIADKTTEQINTFKTAHPEYNFTFTVETVGEGDAATKMVTDVEAGADMYCFAQDQLSRLQSAGALAKVPSTVLSDVSTRNDAGSVKAATINQELRAYPLTSDNGYFMYYDKTVISEEQAKTVEGILAACKSASKTFAFEGTTSAWYEAAYFFAAGIDCHSNWTTNAKGAFIAHDDNFNSEKGKIAAKGLQALVNNESFVSASSVSEFSNGAAAVVSGTWDYASAKTLLGDNLGICELPTFTVDGTAYHLGSFSGFKLVGVKPQTTTDRAKFMAVLADYFTGEACQKERFNSFGWGPSNIALQNSAEVKADACLSALNAQNKYAVPQGQFPSGWWDLGKAIGASLQQGDTVENVLKTYEQGLDACLD